jgi:hypothetical protein
MDLNLIKYFRSSIINFLKGNNFWAHIVIDILKGLDFLKVVVLLLISEYVTTIFDVIDDFLPLFLVTKIEQKSSLFKLINFY